MYWIYLIIEFSAWRQYIQLWQFVVKLIRSCGIVVFTYAEYLFLNVSTDGGNQSVSWLQLVQKHSAAEESKYLNF